jgi:hypothetical protein
MEKEEIGGIGSGGVEGRRREWYGSIGYNGLLEGRYFLFKLGMWLILYHISDYGPSYMCHLTVELV